MSGGADLTPAGPAVDRTVLVTGATGGIGRAVTFELAAAGARVALHGRDPCRVAELASTVGEAGQAAGTFLGDLAEIAPGDLVREVTTALPDLDAAVLIAGVDVLTGAAARWTFEQKLEALLRVDVTATLLMARGLGRWMADRGGGSIVTVGWDQVDVGMEGDSGELFAATKGAVMASTRSLARSLGPTVRVNCVAPGWIRTAWGGQASAAWQRRATRESVLGRWGTPADIAGAVRWLLSPDAAFVTGQVIAVNGGFRRA